MSWDNQNKVQDGHEVSWDNQNKLQGNTSIPDPPLLTFLEWDYIQWDKNSLSLSEVTMGLD